METLNIPLTLEEINVIIEALGKEQFIKVYKIIEKLHIEATKQMHTGDEQA